MNFPFSSVFALFDVLSYCSGIGCRGRQLISADLYHFLNYTFKGRSHGFHKLVICFWTFKMKNHIANCIWSSVKMLGVQNACATKDLKYPLPKFWLQKWILVFINILVCYILHIEEI